MNRKDRRRLEKNLGLKKKELSFKERMELISRKQRAGKQIHKQNIEDIHNNQRALSELKEQKSFDELKSKGFSTEDIKKALHKGE